MTKKITTMTKDELIRNWTNLLKKSIEERKNELPKLLDTYGDEVAMERYIATDDCKKLTIRDINRQILLMRYQKELTKRGYSYDVYKIATKIGEDVAEEYIKSV